MSRAEPRDPERELDDREETQAQGQAAKAAIQQALEQQQRNQRQFIDEIKDPDFAGSDGDAILEEMGAQFAGIHSLANEDADDFRRHLYLTRNKRDRIRAARNPGRLCTGPFLRLATGTNTRENAEIQGALTDRERRLIGEASEAKIGMHTLGKDAKGIESISEITAVTRHQRETEAEDDSSGGVISRIFG